MMRLRLTILCVAAMLLTGIAGCAPNSEGKSGSESQSSAEEYAAELEYPVEIAGARLESRPGIIVSLAPSVTDKLVDMELSDRLEGVSDSCRQPPGFERVHCGNAKTPDIDAILELSPHLVITDITLPDSAAASIRQSGAEIAVIPKASNVDGLYQNYLMLARLLEGDRTGGAVGEAFQKQLQQRVSELSQNRSDESQNAVFIKKLDYEVATGDTLENELMELIGLNNIAKGQTDWLFPEEDASGTEGRAAFESIDFIFCDENDVTIKDMEQSAFYKGLNAVLKDYYLYIDSTAFESQSLRMFGEIGRMQQYSKGEIPGSKDEAASTEA